ncbi:MAG: glycosyltransferase family 2 protein [Acidimicrobiia bacterium]
MALLDPPRSDSPTATALVAALVVVHEGSSLREALEAVERQVYEPETIIVIGGASAPPEGADPSVWAPTVAEAVDRLADDITHVWLLHDDSIARPDALGALVREGARVGADLLGSKILVAGKPGVLESVGWATDVFEVPASGLDVDELDQEQYDVLRDVAFVAGSSMLVDRRMLERVGGPDPRLEPVTASLDLCQRVHLAGGRVVVVPSAEVLHDGSCIGESKPWRVEAGRLRAMLKAYSPVTLLWVVPLNFVLGLLEAIVSPLFGRWRLTAFVQGWLWNLLRLPDTVAARRRVERVAGDRELFRFQVRGSARLTAFWQRLGDRWVAIAASERARSLGHLVESGQETVRRPLVASLLAGVGFALFSTRQFWMDGVATVGYALTPSSSVGVALQSYAGGWNPADLGSPEPLRPVIGAVSLVQVALLGRASATMVVILVLASIAGVVGIARLLGPFGVRPVARYSAGVLFIGGASVRVLAGDGVWHGIVAMVVLPWILTVAFHRRRTASAVMTIGLLTAVGAAFLPLMVVMPVAAMAVWALVDSVDAPRFLGRLVAGAALAVPALLPWLGAIDDLGSHFTDGPDFFWAPSVWVVVLAAVAAGATLAAAPNPLSRLAGWGALLTAGGAVLARAGSFGWGTDPGTAGLSMVGLGMAVIAGASFEAGARSFEVGGARLYLRLAASLAASLLLLGTVTVALPGRLGFPSSGLAETLSFTVEGVPSRALLLGDEAGMPGGGHPLSDSLHYRVVSTPAPRLVEAWPTAPRIGDRALEEVLAGALSGASFRLGEELAGFGIGWIVVTGEGGPTDSLDDQLDLLPLALPGTRAYEVEVAAPRAVDTAGAEWVVTGAAYSGPPGSRTVRLAENADSRWGEQWEQAGWANRVTTDSGLIEFGPVGTLRRAAFFSLLWVGGLVLAAAAIRERELSS